MATIGQSSPFNSHHNRNFFVKWSSAVTINFAILYIVRWCLKEINWNNYLKWNNLITNDSLWLTKLICHHIFFVRNFEKLPKKAFYTILYYFFFCIYHFPKYLICNFSNKHLKMHVMLQGNFLFKFYFSNIVPINVLCSYNE